MATGYVKRKKYAPTVQAMIAALNTRKKTMSYDRDKLVELKEEMEELEAAADEAIDNVDAAITALSRLL
jgi:tetrahydromethanopterin S-methyltransferase subunit B